MTDEDVERLILSLSLNEGAGSYSQKKKNCDDYIKDNLSEIALMTNYLSDNVLSSIMKIHKDTFLIWLKEQMSSDEGEG